MGAITGDTHVLVELTPWRLLTVGASATLTRASMSLTLALGEEIPGAKTAGFPRRPCHRGWSAMATTRLR